MSSILKGIDRVNKFLVYVVAIILIVMSIVISFQVFSRFTLSNSLEWSEELSRYLMIWLVFLGTAVALRKKSLIGVEALSERLGFKKERALKTVVHIVSIIFFGILIFKGFEMLGHVANQKSPAMKIPMTYPYAAIPVGAFFMVMNSIAVLIEYYTVKEEEK
jgi:TRAP-type C4-dicarboxylate transport system permease small subunit